MLLESLEKPYIVTVVTDTGETWDLELPAQSPQQAERKALARGFYKKRRITRVVTTRIKRGAR